MKLFIWFMAMSMVQCSLDKTCPSPIYCFGSLLHFVQMTEIYPDSKTFVDMHMKQAPERILNQWNNLLLNNENKLSKNQTVQFLNTYFDEDTGLEALEPTDYVEEPKFLSTIFDNNLRRFAKELISVWPNLTRRITLDVFENPDRYSIIPIPNRFIVPGGRFREIYYWDTYWIIEGLLLSDMKETVKGMLENFISLIKLYGFIPNGNRVYYQKRSQPPLFAAMVFNYFSATHDKEWLIKNIHFVEKEAYYWLNYRFIKIKKCLKTYELATYAPKSSGPRPESYREDYNIASKFSEDQRERVYNDIKAAAESGWDFSSRWFYDENGNIVTNLSSIQTTRSVPVDLNSFLYLTFYNIAQLYLKLGDMVKYVKWNYRAIKIKVAINDLLWNNKDGIWYDLDLDLMKHRRAFYASNLTPLFVKAFDTSNLKIGKKVLKYLDTERIFQYFGGVPTSLLHSGEQWDLPNAWPPLQLIIIEGLENIGTQSAKNVAKELAIKWLNSNLLGYENTNTLFEKYDAFEPGKYGGGGEYVVQTGFGWTIGVVLKLIAKYFTKYN